MVACVFIPRFLLAVACPGRLAEPLALAPSPGSRQAVGQVSRLAEVDGVSPGMPLAEALGRCPSLRLVRADPVGAAQAWEELLVGLEGIGAAVESERPGEAFFQAEGLMGLYGGKVADVLAAAREAAPMPVRVAAAPSRFASFLAAERGQAFPRCFSEAGPAAIVPSRMLRKFLSPFPISALTASRLGVTESEASELILALKRLGLGTLGKLAGLHPDQLADRFGALGLRAFRLARGEDEPLRPRSPREDLAVEIELPQGAAGAQLDHALELLVDRLLADRGRRERPLLSIRLSALFEGRGSWSAEQNWARPSASAREIYRLLAMKLEALPEPATTLRLEVLAFGEEIPDQLRLALGGRRSSRDRLRRALREVRATAGAEALLEVIDVDPRSRVPERRMLLAPRRER